MRIPSKRYRHFRDSRPSNYIVFEILRNEQLNERKIYLFINGLTTFDVSLYNLLIERRIKNRFG